MVHGRLVEEDAASIYFTHIKISRKRLHFDFTDNISEKWMQVKKLQDEN